LGSHIAKTISKIIFYIFSNLSFKFESFELEKIMAEKIIDIVKEHDVPLYKVRR